MFTTLLRKFLTDLMDKLKYMQTPLYVSSLRRYFPNEISDNV
jgi:hypothetical protein